MPDIKKTGPISLAEITKMLRHHTPGQPLSDEKVIEIIKEVEAQIAKDEDSLRKRREKFL